MMKSRRIRWEVYVARMGTKRNAYRILMGKPEENSPLGRSRRTWVSSIKVDLRETEWDGMDWIGLALDGDQWRAQLHEISYI
jgi:hypothetical protein